MQNFCAAGCVIHGVGWTSNFSGILWICWRILSKSNAGL